MQFVHQSLPQHLPITPKLSDNSNTSRQNEGPPSVGLVGTFLGSPPVASDPPNIHSIPNIFQLGVLGTLGMASSQPLETKAKISDAGSMVVTMVTSKQLSKPGFGGLLSAVLCRRDLASDKGSEQWVEDEVNNFMSACKNNDDPQQAALFPSELPSPEDLAALQLFAEALFEAMLDYGTKTKHLDFECQKTQFRLIISKDKVEIWYANSSVRYLTQLIVVPISQDTPKDTQLPGRRNPGRLVKKTKEAAASTSTQISADQNGTTEKLTSKKRPPEPKQLPESQNKRLCVNQDKASDTTTTSALPGGLADLDEQRKYRAPIWEIEELQLTNFLDPEELMGSSDYYASTDVNDLWNSNVEQFDATQWYLPATTKSAKSSFKLSASSEDDSQNDLADQIGSKWLPENNNTNLDFFEDFL